MSGLKMQRQLSGMFSLELACELPGGATRVKYHFLSVHFGQSEPRRRDMRLKSERGCCSLTANRQVKVNSQ